MSDVVWQALIAAGLAVYMEWSRRRAERSAVAVKDTLKATNKASNARLDAVAERVEEVHKATNSLTDRLVETTRTDAHAAGFKEGSEQSRPEKET